MSWCVKQYFKEAEIQSHCVKQNRGEKKKKHHQSLEQTCVWHTEKTKYTIICHPECLKMPEMVFYYCFYTPLYEKGIKQNQNNQMETTYITFCLYVNNSDTGLSDRFYSKDWWHFSPIFATTCQKFEDSWFPVKWSLLLWL